MPHSPAGLAQAIGVLQGQLNALEQQFARAQEELLRENELARQHRSDLRTVISALSSSMQALTRQVAEAAPLWKDYEEKRAEARGAAKLGKLVYVIIAASFGATGSLLVEWLRAHTR